MAKKQRTRYSIKTFYKWGARTHSFGFWYNPNRTPNIPKGLNPEKLADAKKVLKHCREVAPNIKHQIVKVITIVEILDY